MEYFAFEKRTLESSQSFLPGRRIQAVTFIATPSILQKHSDITVAFSTTVFFSTHDASQIQFPI